MIRIWMMHRSSKKYVSKSLSGTRTLKLWGSHQRCIHGSSWSLKMQRISKTAGSRISIDLVISIFFQHFNWHNSLICLLNHCNWNSSIVETHSSFQTKWTWSLINQVDKVGRLLHWLRQAAWVTYTQLVRNIRNIIMLSHITFINASTTTPQAINQHSISKILSKYDAIQHV